MVGSQHLPFSPNPTTENGHAVQRRNGKWTGHFLFFLCTAGHLAETYCFVPPASRVYLDNNGHLSTARWCLRKFGHNVRNGRSILFSSAGNDAGRDEVKEDDGSFASRHTDKRGVTGRFSAFAEGLNAEEMSAAEFRNALKEKMMERRRNSLGNKASQDYMYNVLLSFWFD
jgi:hypothetical protein